MNMFSPKKIVTLNVSFKYLYELLTITNDRNFSSLLLNNNSLREGLEKNSVEFSMLQLQQLTNPQLWKRYFSSLYPGSTSRQATDLLLYATDLTVNIKLQIPIGPNLENCSLIGQNPSFCSECVAYGG